MKNQHTSKLAKITTAFLGTVALSTLVLTNNAKADTSDNYLIRTSKKMEKPDSEAMEPKIVTYRDNKEKPNNDYWLTPNKYKNDAPVQILGINDLHGNIDTTGHAWVGKRNYQNAGRADRLAGYLNNAEDSFKSQNPSGTTFRVQAGDVVGASPATSALLQDEPTLKSLKAMKIEIGTLGNHEFDEGLDEFHRALIGAKPKENEFNSVEMNYPHEDSKMQIVIANITKKSDGKIPFNWQPYVVKEVKTINGAKSKIAFIGIDTSDLANLTFAKNVAPYNVRDEADAIAQYDKELRAKGINAIVVLAHTGVSSYKGKTTGQAVDILKKLYKIDPDNSVDIYIAAHSHQYANASVGHTKLVQANRFAMAYDDVVGYIDPKTNDFVPGSLISHVYPVMNEKDSQKYDSQIKIIPDKKVTAIINDAQQRTRSITERSLVKVISKQDISKMTKGYKGESPVGKLLLDGELYEAAKQGKPADFAITNSGGIRADLRVNKNNGNVVWKDAQAVQPFGNRLEIVEITGDQLYKVLNAQYQAGKNLVFEVAGMSYVYMDDPSDKIYPQKVVLIYDKNGKLINKSKTYKLIISNYLASWKDVFGGLKVGNDLGTDTATFVQYLEDMGKSGKNIVSPLVAGTKLKKSQKEIAKLLAGTSANNQKHENNDYLITDLETLNEDNNINNKIVDLLPKKDNKNEIVFNQESKNLAILHKSNVKKKVSNKIYETNNETEIATISPYSKKKKISQLKKQLKTKEYKLPKTSNKSNTLFNMLAGTIISLVSLLIFPVKVKK